ncbi:hypothetical protein PWT90_05162 [Aphanocladium album]|nr:hypothetical protein PWT90_05162 [Aphanocladium album]
MQALFSRASYTEEEVTCQIVDCLGPLPAKWHENREDGAKFFDDGGGPADGHYVWPKIREVFRQRVQQFRREDNMGEFCEAEEAAILDIMTPMLNYSPAERPTIEQVFQPDWMVNWAKPE